MLLNRCLAAQRSPFRKGVGRLAPHRVFEHHLAYIVTRTRAPRDALFGVKGGFRHRINGAMRSEPATPLPCRERVRRKAKAQIFMQAQTQIFVQMPVQILTQATPQAAPQATMQIFMQIYDACTNRSFPPFWRRERGVCNFCKKHFIDNKTAF